MSYSSSYEEKGSWVYLLVVSGTCAAYVVTILNRADGGPVSDVAYRSPMLWTMGAGMALTMVGRILVEMVRPSETHRTDVRDRDIGRYGEYVGGTVLAAGMLVAFVLTLATADHFWIANTMFAAFALATVVGAAVRLVAYRRGLRAWVNQPG
jgi:hypothetical protein